MDRFVERAIDEAEKSCMNKRYGAVLIYRNKIVSSGHNQLKNGLYLNNGLDDSQYVLCS